MEAIEIKLFGNLDMTGRFEPCRI